MPIQNIVDELAKDLGHPITLVDADGRLIAYSVHEGPVDPVRLEILLRKGPSKATIEAFKQRGIYASVDMSPGITRVPPIPEIGLTARLCAAIRSGSKILGYLWVADNGQLAAPGLEDKIRRTCALLAEELRDQDKSGGKRRQPELVSDLIGGQAVDPELLSFRAKAIGWHPEPPYQVVVVKGAARGSEGSREVLVRDFEEILQRRDVGWLRKDSPGEVVLVYGGTDLSRCHDRAGSSNTSREPCPGHGATNRVTDRRRPVAGVGTAGDDLSHCAVSYREAVAAISLGERLGLSGPCFNYRDIAPYELVACLPLCKPADDYGRKMVEKVLAYDGVREGDLFTTLEAFLDMFGQRTAVARKLNIHPNTLDYRIKRIKEIMRADFEEPELRFLVHVWIKALRAAKHGDLGK